MPVSIIAENLARFGFSQYESKAYIALIKKSPVTGYELAKNSGIPPSKIYEVINKLLEKSVITPVQTDPVKYIPQDINILLKKIQDDTTASINTLKKHLPKAKGLSSHYIWDINSRQDLINKAKELILSCREEMLLFCWDQELNDLVPELERRRDRKIVIIQYGTLPLNFGVIYRHLLEKEKIKEKGGREFTLVTDNSHLLQAIISESKSNIGVMTANESLVGVAKDFIRHDIYCWKLINKLEKHVKETFGEDFKKLRDIYSK
ncbi:TrmB family transcriptional regulator [candidate division KSB1 bacterium]|nr:TrmB family transcriptional regulator [candidate division KSB1 bacterium]